MPNIADYKSSLEAKEIESRLVGGVVFNKDMSGKVSEEEKAIARNNIGATAFGQGIKIVSHYDNLAQLEAAVPKPKPGDAYSVGAALPYNLYIFDLLDGSWKDYGPIRSADISARLAQNVTVSSAAWVYDDAVFPDYHYKARIPMGEINGGDFSFVGFSPHDATAGNFSPICFSFDGAVEIWARAIPDAAILIPSISFIVLPDNSGAASTKGITNACGGVGTEGVTNSMLAKNSVTADKLAPGSVLKVYTATIRTDWEGDSDPYTQTVLVDGLPASDRIFSGLVLSDDYATAEAENAEYNKLFSMKASSGMLYVTATDKTEQPLNINLYVFHGNGMGTGGSGGSGEDSMIPYIGDNGNWYIGKDDTGKPSRGEKGDMGDSIKGDKGDTGERGTGILNTTTGIAAYTTSVGGVSPKYRILLSTLKTQAKVNEVLIGDTVRYSTFLYPIIYVDNDYAYMTTRVSIQGATGATGTAGTTPVKGTDYWTEDDKAEIVEAVGEAYVGLTFDTFPTEAEVNALSNWDYFTTKGFYAKNDGLGSVYQVKTSGGNFYVPYGNMYFRPVEVDADHRDINVDLYGIRRGSADYAARNSEIMNALASTLQNGFTLHFGSGQYYFATPIPHIEKHIAFKGVCTNASVIVEAVNYGSYLHFPNLANGEAAISISGGVVQDLGIIGNSSVCNVSIDRSKSITDRDGVVSLVDKGTTYGIKIGSWGYTVQNVRIRNCTYGIYGETSNALITNVDTHQCKIGVSVGNDTKVNNIQVWNVMVGVQLRGQLASATNIRGDSIGKHLIECWGGKCLLSNIDGDYCVGSLIHYGDGTKKYMHLGQAIGCMGRVATRTAFARSGSFDLRNVSDGDYEYCSYISIAPYTQVFGGHIEVSNVKANIMDTASGYVHPDAPISIGTGSTVKGVTIKCNVPYDADVEYFNSSVIKNLSTNAESQNSDVEYVTDFDGKTVEDINFITPIGFIRSKRILGALNRVLEFSKDANGAVLFTEQNLTEGEKAQARKNVGLDNISSLEFVASIESCTDSNKTYVLPDGRTVAYAEKPSYTNLLPISTTNTGAIFNAGDTPGYKLGYFEGNDTEASAETWRITGFIPAKPNDILRMYNMRFFETDLNVIPGANSKTRILLYEDGYKYKNTSTTYSPTNLPSSAWAPAYDETGNVVQLKIPTAYGSNIRYIRMCVRDINQDSVITVNEEMGPPKAEFGETGLRFVTEEVYKKINALISGS